MLQLYRVQSKISSTFWDFNNGLRADKRVGVSQAFAMISVKPPFLQQHKPLMMNVASPLDIFSEQRITLPLARAQQRENKVKEGMYCPDYLNKWLKGVEDVWQCGTVYGHEQHWHPQHKKSINSKGSQALWLTLNLYPADTLLLFGNEWHDFTVYAGPQIPRQDVNSMISMFLHMDLSKIILVLVKIQE